MLPKQSARKYYSVDYLFLEQSILKYKELRCIIYQQMSVILNVHYILNTRAFFLNNTNISSYNKIFDLPQRTHKFFFTKGDTFLIFEKIFRKRYSLLKIYFYYFRQKIYKKKSNIHKLPTKNIFI